MTIVSIICITCGVFFLGLGAVGLLRFPDFYTRMHAAGKCDTLGILLVLVGLAILEGPTLTGVKIIFIGVFLFLTSPSATHAIAKAALSNDVQSQEDNTSL